MVMPTVAERLGLPRRRQAADPQLRRARVLPRRQRRRSSRPCARASAPPASLLVPAPWAREAASRFRGDDVGVRLTLNAEHDLYRWGPITQAPSLLDGDGGFPRTVTDVWDHADLDEVRRECRAQVERAVLWGFDISHLDTHLDALLLRPEFFDVYLELAVDFGLPLRMLGGRGGAQCRVPDPPAGRRRGGPVRRPLPHLPARHPGEAFLELLPTLEPGLTEITLRPAVDTPELRAVTADWDQRVSNHIVLVDDRGLGRAIRDAGVIPIGFRPLRDAMRRG